MQWLQLDRSNLAAVRADEVRRGRGVGVPDKPSKSWGDSFENLVIMLGYMPIVVVADYNLLHLSS